jgi:phenylalanyl-tRNA synthetase beta chain
MDITIPADVVEEVVRIDGLDSIEIPGSITISPALEDNPVREKLKEKLSALLTGMGFHEIITNSITNSKNFSGTNFSGIS